VWDAFSPFVVDSRGSSSSMLSGLTGGLVPVSCHLVAASLSSTPVHSTVSQTVYAALV
jgi:hypothetical protein